MYKIKLVSVAIITIALGFSACKSMNKTQKGAVIGTSAGGATGAVIGRASGNTALGAMIGAAVGGVTGVLIGKKMDKQAEEIKKQIPDVEVVRVGEGIVVEFANDVLFGFDSYALSASAKETLGKLVKVLNMYPDTDISIAGHTDSKGAASYNQVLSLQRADAVGNYLNEQNIPDNRIVTLGYGAKNAKYSNATASGQAMNRRVEFVITANEKMITETAKEASN